MANFKVIFRSDNRSADVSPGWEPGCPLLVNAVQVSRNTDTGQCYLQLKLSNISGATVNSFKLQADVSYADGVSETVELNPLDADIQPAKTYRPEPLELTGSEIASVSVRVLEVSQPSGPWHTRQAPEPIPAGSSLALEQFAAIERKRTLIDLGKSSDDYDRAIAEGDTWWVCPCGMPNVERDTCCACGITRDTLRQLEDEAYLHVKSAERKEAEQRKGRKRKGAAAVFSIIALTIIVVSVFLFNQFVIQPQAATDALPACFVPSQQTLYDEDGAAVATQTYSLNEYGSMEMVKTQGVVFSAIEYTAPISCNENGFPLSIEDNKGSKVELSVNKTNEKGLPLKASASSSSNGDSNYSFEYYPNGTLKTVIWEKDGNSSITTYDENGFPKEATATGESDGSTTTSYSYSGSDPKMPERCSVHTENAAGDSLDQEWSFEYSGNGTISKIFVDGVIQREYSYTNVEHTVPWTYAIACTKPFNPIFF